jgi:serine/threonine protein kinase
VAGFARLLGGAVEMSRLRRQLSVAQARQAETRRQMHDRGIATLQICPVCRRCFDHTATACEEDGTPLEAPRPVPYRLLGRHRFLRVLGEGGMGLVLSAHDEKLGRDVAVKLIRPERWSHVEVRQRFEREARAVARIQHPGVVELHDSGELEDGTAFLVMENLTGSDLANVLKVHGPGTRAQVARLVRQGCAALAAAHRAGVIHRDVKPENVFLVRDPAGFRVKLVDFGLAKSLTLEQGLTQSGMVVGTPAYMAPEQVQGREVDARSDLYSFAAVAYEALTGRKAITGTDLGRVFIHVLTTVPEPVSTLVPGLPPEVDEAFGAALSKDPEDRPGDVEAWASALASALESEAGDPGVGGWPA